MTNRVLKRVAIACCLNFVAFVAVALELGGDALNGKATGGHYFLGSHGQLTEVSKPVFIYSAFHAVSAIAGVIVFIFIGRRLKAGSSANSN